ncbi:unnamed protein product [Paramecium pentaurelia]|uniref:Uncharacterized protein n=1 Tax=Paramecium pentaurelia TaxID=43138 RepID=A0A8S1TSQ3_9CILI|nr:unnamed protein product [Paramecium pentaurelia]
MGGQQSYGQAISTYNEKKAIIIGQVNVQTNIDHMTEIIVALGNEIHPQLWNVAIMEMRSTDTDFPLTYRRFCLSNPVEEYQNQYIPEKINQFASIQRPQRTEFHMKTGHFWTILIPSYIQEHLQNDESNLNAQIIYPFCDKTKLNLYREQYQQTYVDVFKKIEQEMSNHSAYISVGILDMQQNNPILGIDNYSMTQDIINAFTQCTPKIHKLIFISENETQAFIMGMALKDKTRELYDITNGFMEQEKQQVDQIMNQNEVPIKAELEIQFKQDEDIQLNSNNLQQEIQNLHPQIQKIQKPNVVSYNNGHKQNIVYQYFREFNVPLNQEVFQTILPRVGSDYNKLCLCGRNLTVRNEGNQCCYCGLQRPTLFQCEQRACGRQYCPSCFNPTKLFNLCMQGHQMKYIDALNNTQQCFYCRQSTYRLGYFFCETCSFKICAYCYYQKYSEWQFKKMKIYLNCLKKIKPNYRQEVSNQLITEYLMDANLQKLRQK